MHSTIFDFNKVVTELDIETTYVRTLRYLYPHVGHVHVVTGVLKY